MRAGRVARQVEMHVSNGAASSRAAKAWLIGALWVLQFVVFYLGPALLVSIHEWSGTVWNDLAGIDYVVTGLVMATLLAAVQGAFLLPIRAPLAKENSRPSRWRLLAIALCIAGVAGAVVAYLVMGLSQVDLLRLSDNEIMGVFGGAWLVLVARRFCISRGGSRPACRSSSVW